MNTINIIYLTALFYGIDPHLALSVAIKESNLNPNSIGKKGDIGLFQVRYRFVSETKEELLNPEVNAKAGVRILKQSKRQCHLKKNNQWLICYNRGVSGAKRLKYPELDEYHLEINKIYKCLKKYSYKQLTLNPKYVNICMKGK